MKTIQRLISLLKEFDIPITPSYLLINTYRSAIPYFKDEFCNITLEILGDEHESFKSGTLLELVISYNLDPVDTSHYTDLVVSFGMNENYEERFSVFEMCSTDESMEQAASRMLEDVCLEGESWEDALPVIRCLVCKANHFPYL